MFDEPETLLEKIDSIGGTINNVAIVDRARPPKTNIPIPLYSSEPAPGKITKGTNPKRDVKVDINIGRILFLVASIIAFFTSIPSSLTCKTVCSTSKIALLTTMPVNITNPNIVNISNGCFIN